MQEWGKKARLDSSVSECEERTIIVADWSISGTYKREGGQANGQVEEGKITDGVPFPWRRLWGRGAIRSSPINEAAFLWFGCGVEVARAAGAVSALHFPRILGFWRRGWFQFVGDCRYASLSCFSVGPSLVVVCSLKRSSRHLGGAHLGQIFLFWYAAYDFLNFYGLLLCLFFSWACIAFILPAAGLLRPALLLRSDGVLSRLDLIAS